MITMLADHLWQSTLVAVALGLLTLTLRENAARLRFCVWFCASIKFLVPFSLFVALGHWLGGRTPSPLPSLATLPAGLRAVQVSELIERVTEPVAALGQIRSSPATVVATPPHVDLGQVVVVLWATGTAIVLGIWLVRWLRLMTLVRRSHPLIDPHCDGFALEVRVSRTLIEPGVVGIFGPIVLLPHGIAELLTPAQLRTIITHELWHVRRRDNLAAAVHMVVEALFWFHPLVWWIGARLVDERERACDEAVLAELDDRDRYASAIVAVCELCVRSPLACAAGIGGTSGLRERIERLVSGPRVRGLGALQRGVLAATAAALIIAPIAIGVLNPPLARAQDAAAPRSAFDDGLTSDGSRLDPPGMWLAGARVTATDLALRDLISHAFGVQRRQIVGPEALDSRRYTIVGELPSVDYRKGVDPMEQYRAYWRGLLEERFALAFHRETRVVPALILVRGAWSPGLKPTSEEYIRWFGRGPRPCFSQEPCTDGPNHANAIEARGIPIGTLVQFLSATFDTPILDQTNLTERYDFTLEWPAEAARAERQGWPSNEVIRKALDEQLGLKLLEAGAPVEQLVVDRISEPRNVPDVADTGADPPAVILRDAIPSIANGTVLELTIDRRGAMHVGPNLDTALDARSIVAIAKEAVSRDAKVTAVVSADGMIANHRVVEAANLLEEAGIARIRFATLGILPNSVLDDSLSLNRAPLPERGVALTTPRP